MAQQRVSLIGQLTPEHFLAMVQNDGREAPEVCVDGVIRASLTTRRAFPIVMDANVLRNDIAHFVRHGGPTVLVNVALCGIANAFCARHVVEEVEEHRTEWARDAGVDSAAFDAAWHDWYGPILRCVEPDADLAFTADERRRLDVLSEADADDVPSAKLALALNAPLISEDVSPLKAVYGDRYSYEELRKWLSLLQATGEAGALDLGHEAALSIGRLVGLPLWTALRIHPLPTVALASVAWLACPPHRRAQAVSAARGFGLTALELAAELGRLDREALARQEAFPQVDAPTESELNEALGARARRRSVAAWMSRQPSPNWSASQLASTVSGGRFENSIRADLRGSAMFHEVERGRFQLGIPIRWPPSQQ